MPLDSDVSHNRETLLACRFVAHETRSACMSREIGGRMRNGTATIALKPRTKSSHLLEAEGLRVNIAQLRVKAFHMMFLTCRSGKLCFMLSWSGHRICVVTATADRQRTQSGLVRCIGAWSRSGFRCCGERRMPGLARRALAPQVTRSQALALLLRPHAASTQPPSTHCPPMITRCSHMRWTVSRRHDE